MQGSLPSPLLPSFSALEFRAALGRFATGVTIVTTRAADGTPVGLTANSFNSVSLTPPLVLWSLALRAGTQPVFAGASHYAIHILRSDQRELAERFATKGADRFAGLPDRSGIGGVPLLDGCAAVFECRNRSRHAEGDHVIFVGEVEHCSVQAEAPPLIFHGGRFYTELPL
jgi:flavin reductase (DIM6/NTAB) family NADH-FMN oxidoreductase RutF